MKTEAEFGAMHLSVKKRYGLLAPPEVGRGRKDPLLELLERAWNCQHLILDFWPSEVTENKFLLF